MKAHSFTLALASLASALTAQTVVPRDFPTLDLAVAASSSGDIILVRTAAVQPPTIIDKSITIIGEPIVTVGYSCGPTAPISLSGPGTGKVELVNCSVDRSADCARPQPGIGGGGFTDLVLQNCNIPAPVVGLTGLGYGAAGIQVNVSNVIVTDSFIAGAGPDSDHCAGFLPDEREAGIDAPGATVLLLDSTVHGGDGGLLCCENPLTCSGCPASLAGLGGLGGDGVICESLFVANSTVTRGAGSQFVFNDLINGTQTICGQQPDGERYVVNLYANLGNDLTLTGPIRIGKPFKLSWNSTGPATALNLSFGFSLPPRFTPGAGWTFGDISTFRLATFFGGGPVVLSLPVPSSPGLLGMDVNFQLIDSTDGISRPVTAIIEN